jgi:hypothetical protein
MPPRRWSLAAARLMWVWFALALGVAAASPLVQPRAMQLVCSAEGAVKLLVDTGEGLAEAAPAHPLDCALCLLASAPPPAPPQARAPQAAAPQAQAWARAEAPVRPHARAPLPARGPPAFF